MRSTQRQEKTRHNLHPGPNEFFETKVCLPNVTPYQRRLSVAFKATA
jgi:hypothetical protein